jgi:DNA-binding IclR family transcriptional regulator
MVKPLKQLDRHIESVLAALDVMDCFLENPKLSIKQIVDKTLMTRNRVTRILGTLVHRGYAMEALENGTFTTGPKLKALGSVFEDNQNLVVLARPVLRQLSLKTGESASFYIREGSQRVVLAREEGTHAIRFSVAVGQRMDLHAGASGKVLLAYMPEAERDIILTSKKLERLTPQTITNPKRLLDGLTRIRNLGYALSKGERNSDAFSLAAPVFERKDQLIGSLAIAGPISRFTPESEKIYLTDLMIAARTLSEQFSLKDNK